MITTINGIPADQWNERNRIWQENCRKRLDCSSLDLEKLVHTLCDQTWMRHCEIIPEYMFPFPREGDRPIVAVRWTDPEGEREERFLRYSKGPAQGYFWDIYPDDMHSPELAVVSLSRSFPPPGSKFSFRA